MSSAPANLRYDKMLGSFTVNYKKWGVQENYTGLYFGGASPVHSHVANFVQGSNAGFYHAGKAGHP